MKLTLLWVGKTTTTYFTEATNEYLSRLKFYLPVEVVTIPDLKQTKALTQSQQRDKEGELILKSLDASDYVVLLDDKGRQFTSVEFAHWIEQRQHASVKRLVFVIGGAYGFSQAVYDRANTLVSISKMTFSHQIVRPIFAEQLYRAMTILKGEPYHHEESLLTLKK
ncbi:MAG TPA: 23S rRNA (pseudouridine(1915)-N(3))-methyltransferase RlmH [Paludibacteraceae bacterium]|nr:23S rRNA (pseudouridine(1915)-N(3))-methyltransferase RlmH [Paludibacteraceae bacterium]HRS67632.1 23S rRNA (pseudouridine(1915)-N(3))-methyltransferase RlmH [Paludibacteraceae bacterium]